MSTDSEGGSELDNLIETGKKGRRNCCSSHPLRCSAALSVIIVLLLVFIVLGAVFQSRIDGAVKDVIGQHVKLTRGSTATAQFVHSSAPLYTTYYFFNVTNSYQVAHHRAKPILQQIGPYVYRENRTAFDLKWLENDTVLSYSTNITYTWDQEKSLGNHPDRDIITTVNVPLIGVFKTVSGMNSTVVNLLLDLIEEVKSKLNWEGLFVKHSVSDLLWGYKDQLLSALDEGHKLLHFIPAPDPVFAFANISTVEKPNRVHTGIGDLRNVSRYIEWNNNTNMSGWGNQYAAMINGTGGYSFHPGVSREETLDLFIDELFRSGYFKYDSDMIDHGIRLYKFILPDEELKSSVQAKGGFPSNHPDGVLDMSPVVPENLPFYASKPHFLHADPIFRQNVSGMHPDPDIHDSYLAVEPITGAVMNAAKRIQLNLKVDQSSHLAELENIPDSTTLPIYYAVQAGKVTPELANEFKDQVFTVRYGILGSLWALLGVAGVVVVVLSLCLCRIGIQYHRKHKKSDRQIQYTDL